MRLVAAQEVAPAPEAEPAQESATAQESTPVAPATGSSEELPPAAVQLEPGPGAHLDRLHDRFYRWLQERLVASDEYLGGQDRAPLVVPLSPLRIGLGVQALHREPGWKVESVRDFDATLQLPNLKQRYRLFISSGDLPEAPRPVAPGGNPLLAGVRVESHRPVSLDLGIHLKLVPAAFAALRWAPGYNFGALQVFPFAKAYVETGMGPGASGGLTLQRHWNRWIARSSSFADWRRNAAATSWTQSLVAGYARAVIRERRYDLLATGNDLACGAMLGLTVTGDRASHATAYEAALLVKRPLRGGWLYGYAAPLVRWERAGNWHPDAGVRVGVDILFWGLATAPDKVAAYCR
jgi:hypothetical protein